MCGGKRKRERKKERTRNKISKCEYEDRVRVEKESYLTEKKYIYRERHKKEIYHMRGNVRVLVISSSAGVRGREIL